MESAFLIFIHNILFTFVIFVLFWTKGVTLSILEEDEQVNLEELRKFERIALVSVYNKDGKVDQVQRLVNLGYGILSSGGTAKVLSDGGIAVCDVSELVGGGAILGHKVVTLSREVHAGLLADDCEIEELEALGILRIDLVAVDLYPLEEEISKPDCTRESVIAKTDIGGPTMLSSAAKGGRIVISLPEDWEPTLTWMEAGCPNMTDVTNAMRVKADMVVAKYRLFSANFHSGGKVKGVIGHRVAECEYGENRHQVPAGLFTLDTDYPLAIDRFELVAGRAASFNNYNDMSRLVLAMTRAAAAYDIAYESGDGKPQYLAFVCKHGNLCGAGTSVDDPVQAVKEMVDGDRRAILGGVVMLNFPLTEEIAEILLSYHLRRGEKRRNLDCISAPEVSEDAIELLRRKKDKCRFMANPALENLDRDSIYTGLDIRLVQGGFLAQPASRFILNLADPLLEKPGMVSAQDEDDLTLAWAIGSSSCSNSIVIVKDGMLLGLAAAQQDRVTACKVAIMRARAMRHDLTDAVAYSDSFFPFDDGPKVLVKAGISTIFASSGSIHDGDVKSFCAQAGIALFMMPDELCRGFLH